MYLGLEITNKNFLDQWFLVKYDFCEKWVYFVINFFQRTRHSLHVK